MEVGALVVVDVNHPDGRLPEGNPVPGRADEQRYYCLWGSQLLCSYLLLLFLEWLLPGIWPTVNKAAGDIILAICSYQIQMHWVFREEKAHGAG